MKWDPYENGYLGEFFSVDQYDSKDEPCVVKDARELKLGTSYSEHMLDLNELMEKGVVHRDDKIDLSEMPEIETIQAASQEQLDMLTPESKKQIKAIHLSNNTPFGWNEELDYNNIYGMDTNLDLSSYENVSEVQTHFYVNNDLEDIVLPPKVTEILCQHSKMENLRKHGNLEDIKVEASSTETAFVSYYGREKKGWEFAQDYLRTGDIEKLHAFKEHGGDMQLLLSEAIKKGSIDTVQEVVENGADVNKNTVDYCGDTLNYPLEEAVSEDTRDYQRRDIVEYLIAQGAKLEGREGSYSPLSIQLRQEVKDYKCIDLLLKSGAPVTSEDVKSALSDAKAFEVLMKNGYQPTDRDMSTFVRRNYDGAHEQDLGDKIKIVNLMVQARPDALKEGGALKDFESKYPELQQYRANMTKAAENSATRDNREYLKAVMEKEKQRRYVQQEQTGEKAENKSVAPAQKNAGLHDLKNHKDDLAK